MLNRGYSMNGTFKNGACNFQIAGAADGLLMSANPTPELRYFE